MEKTAKRGEIADGKGIWDRDTVNRDSNVDGSRRRWRRMVIDKRTRWEDITQSPVASV